MNDEEKKSTDDNAREFFSSLLKGKQGDRETMQCNNCGTEYFILDGQVIECRCGNVLKKEKLMK